MRRAKMTLTHRENSIVISLDCNAMFNGAIAISRQKNNNAIHLSAVGRGSNSAVDDT